MMTMETVAAQRLSAAPVRPSAPSTVLRRTCACGGAPGPTGECEQCGKKRLGLRRSASSACPALAPSVVHDVLRSPGSPLDAGTRAFMEPRFGYSFADVRVHTDKQAARSAAAVGARAYAVGRDVVFAGGRFAPQSAEGRRLLAHELAHVVQQRGATAASASLEVGSTDAPEEREAEAAANVVMDVPAAARMAPHVAAGTMLSRRAAILSRNADCDSAEAALPFTFDFTIEHDLKSRSFMLPKGQKDLTLELKADYHSPPLGSAGDVCFQLVACGTIWNSNKGKRCIEIDSGKKKVTWSDLSDGEIHYFRIWKGEQDGLTIDAEGTAS